MKKGYVKCPFCANEIKEGAIKCQFCEEFLDGKDKNFKGETEKNIEKKGGKGKRLLVVLYFIITLPILGGIIFSLFEEIGISLRVSDSSSYGYHRVTIINYYHVIFWTIISILAYVLITNFLKRICSFISNGTFNGFLNYRKIFGKYRIYLLITIMILIGTFILGLDNGKKYECGEGEMLSGELICVCDSENGYNEKNGKCEKSIFYDIANAVLEYADERTSINIGSIYGVDRQPLNDDEGILLFVDTSVEHGSEPLEIDAKYGDITSCSEEVEGVSSVKGQGYIVAYERIGGKIIINDFFKVPSMWGEYMEALNYPILNLKQNNYIYYGGEKPNSEEDGYLLESSYIINLRDLDGDGKELEFFIINHAYHSCGTHSYLLLGYDDIKKKIKQYYFVEDGIFKTWVSLTDRSQNEFIGGLLKQQYYGGGAHRGPCDEYWEYKYQGNNIFEMQNYKRGDCDYSTYDY